MATFSFRTLLAWLIITALTAMMLNKDNKTLDSMSKRPSDIYPEDFYPNGTYLELPLGTMRYWLFGKEEGRRVVLVHGITTGSCIYDKLARDLASHGYHVLVYDLWGRGYSDAPDVRYDETLYTTQLSTLLDKVKWDKTDVVGLSLGGGIATSFTAIYPEKVNKLVLLAPAGLMRPTDFPKAAALLKIPYLPQVITKLPIRSLIRFFGEKYAKLTYALPSDMDADTVKMMDKVTAISTIQIDHHAGFIKAFIGTLIAFPFDGLKESFYKVGHMDKEILVIWGDTDKTVPYPSHLDLQSILPRAEISIMIDEGHEAIIMQSKKVNESIDRFLSY